MKLRTTILLSTIATLSIPVVHAAAGAAVAHSHNGRSHSHSLPATGKNHSHGKKAASKAKKAPVAHSHNGRSHKHSLPATGKNHSHGKKTAPKAKSAVDSTPKGWRHIGSGVNTGNVVRYKFGSSKIVGGYATGVISWTRDNFTEIEKNAISKSDCKAGFGTTKVQTMAGVLVSSDDFAFGSTNLGSSIAQFICYINNLADSPR